MKADGEVRAQTARMHPWALPIGAAAVIGFIGLAVLCTFAWPFLSLLRHEDDFVIVNRNAGALTNVVVTRHGTVVETFERIGSGSRGLVQDPGLGSFSVEWSDEWGRWFMDGVLYQDEDDTRGRREPAEIQVQIDPAGFRRVNNAVAERVR